MKKSKDDLNGAEQNDADELSRQEIFPPADKQIGFENGPDELAEGALVTPRQRDTQAPVPEPPVTGSQVVEIVEEILKPIRKKQSDIHGLLMGKEDLYGDMQGGLGKAFHDLNNHLTAIKSTVESTYLLLADELFIVREANKKLAVRIQEVEEEIIVLRREEHHHQENGK